MNAPRERAGHARTDSTTPWPKAEDPLYYGYQWWLDRSRLRDRDIAWTVGIGEGGQRLSIARELDLVVVVNSAHYLGGPLHAIIPAGILNKVVLPAVKD